MRATALILTAAAPFVFAGAAAASQCDAPAPAPAPETPDTTETIDLVETQSPVLRLVGEHDGHDHDRDRRRVEKDQDIRVEIKDGEVHVWIDGEKIDPSELKGKVVKAEGDTVYEIIAGERRGDARRSGRASQAPKAPAAPSPSSKPVRLGVVLSELSDALANQLHLDGEQAVLVERVLAGTPADKAGLRPRDVIVEFDDEDGVTITRLRELIGKKSPGDRAEVEVLREGEEVELKVIFQSAGGPDHTEAPEARLRFHGHLGDREAEERLAEALEKAERNAKKIEREWSVRLGDAMKKGRGGLAIAIELDDAAREEIEKAMATLEKTLAQHNFDFDMDFEFEGFPRMRFIETEKAYDTLRKKADEKARQIEEKAIVLERRQDRMKERAQRLVERQQVTLERQRERAERHIERLEGRIDELESVIEKLVHKLESMSEDAPRGIRN